MLYDTSVRVQELADLNLSSLHLDVQNPFVTLIGKGRKSRNVLLLHKTVLHLNEYLEEFHPNFIENPLFFSILDNRPHRLLTYFTIWNFFFRMNQRYKNKKSLIYYNDKNTNHFKQMNQK